MKKERHDNEYRATSLQPQAIFILIPHRSNTRTASSLLPNSEQIENTSRCCHFCCYLSSNPILVLVRQEELWCLTCIFHFHECEDLDISYIMVVVFFIHDYSIYNTRKSLHKFIILPFCHSIPFQTRKILVTKAVFQFIRRIINQLEWQMLIQTSKHITILRAIGSSYPLLLIT